MSNDTNEPPKLLDGIRVVEFGAEPAARTGRVLADLGADVVRIIGHSGDPLRARPSADLAFNAGKAILDRPDEKSLVALVRGAHIVIDEPHTEARSDLDPSSATNTHWIYLTPFGMTGPRASWKASDLGIMAASGNLFSTGDPSRAPVRPSEPASYGHVAGEAAYAAIAAVASGRRQIVDISIAECVLIANMGAAGRNFSVPSRGSRVGAKIGRTREVWPTLDGFVSFGIRGGKARQKSMGLISKLVSDSGITEDALDANWATWSQNTATDAELESMESAIGKYFAMKTSAELYEIACETNLMLAPVNSPREVFASAQLNDREFFMRHGEIEQFPRSFVKVHGAAQAGPGHPTRVLKAVPLWDAVQALQKTSPDRGAWDGVNILEFGSGAAGPIATRYFVEHGATVLRIESPSRPDFLRSMAIGPDNPHGLEGGALYDALNCGKRHVTLNLKHPDSVALVMRLVTDWADAVSENFAPKAMAGFGLDYATLSQSKPDLVMISACLNGQTGPHKDYPGFGGQGSALAGWNWVTGWPDLEPVGPYGTITDSLAPRYVAAALAAGLHYRNRIGRGCHVDVSQVEAGLYALSAWLLDYELNGTVGMRMGNDHPLGRIHGVYPCQNEGEIDDRWVAIAAWTDGEFKSIEKLIGTEATDTTVGAWTRRHSRVEVVNALQAIGVEAIGVADFVDVFADPQLAARSHFELAEHPLMGPGAYEHNGIRFDRATNHYGRSGPLLGQDNDWVLKDILGLNETEIGELAASGAFD